jgi:RNA polymerase sigma-70 factor (ECF subfamily)
MATSVSDSRESDVQQGCASAPNDEALVERARHDPAAFAMLYQTYVRPVHAFCYRRLGTREAAEDATSQVFVNALAHLGEFESGSFRAWLFTIARHVVIDALRKPLSAVLVNADGVVDGAQRPEEAALVAESDRRVRRMLDQLTSEQRDIVLLRLAGLNGAEIAQVLGRSHGSVRAAQFRAYQRLRTIVAETGVSSDE